MVETYVARLDGNESASSITVRASEDDVIAPPSRRVRVAVRVRPPFDHELAREAQLAREHEQEIRNAGNPDRSDGSIGPPIVVTCDSRSRRGGRVILSPSSRLGSAREFHFDHSFPAEATQEDVYDEVGGPIVANVLEGYNGTILAYGQTGTGKTYTMGILDQVTGEHTGLIPRALSHIYGFMAERREYQWKVSMSFVQIYLEAVQDLFATQHITGRADDTSVFQNLNVREDPHRGFYVEGAREFQVRSFEEALELLNWGLSHRVMGSTQMNETSSRSHTLLTVRVERRPVVADGRPADPQSTTLRGKLMLVDLAGSERVRRTTSEGKRLVEARSINQSLSALGNVIAALADRRAKHVPYRDSKLTRLLQDNLGGQAHTYLVATVGPCRVDYSETLSTLQFAARCMRVAAAPVQHEEVDYATLAARLQLRLAGMERELLSREAAMQARYEERINSLTTRLREMEIGGAPTPALMGGEDGAGRARGVSGAELALPPRPPRSAGPPSEGAFSVESATDSRAWRTTAELIFDALCTVVRRLEEVTRNCATAEEEAHRGWLESLSADEQAWERQQLAQEGMAKNDPMESPERFGPHLPPLPRSQVKRRIEDAELAGDAVARKLLALVGEDVTKGARKRAFTDLSRAGSAHVGAETARLRDHAIRIAHTLGDHISSRADSLVEARSSWADSEVQRRQREEELTNQSYVLKYLVDTNARLRLMQSMEQEAEDVAAAPPNAATPTPPPKPHANSPTPAKSTSPVLARVLRRSAAQAKADALWRRQAGPEALAEASPRPLSESSPSEEGTRETGEEEEGGGGGEGTGADPWMGQPRGIAERGSVRSRARLPASSGGGSAAAPPPMREDRERNGRRVEFADLQRRQELGEEGKGEQLEDDEYQAPEGAEDEDEVEDDDVVEAVVASRWCDGRLLYKVHWKGTTEAEDEWFDRQDLLEDFPEVVENFEAGAAR